jgi:DNA-binding transcriptional regulator YdaS (Cro superfamily)
MSRKKYEFNDRKPKIEWLRDRAGICIQKEFCQLLGISPTLCTRWLASGTQTQIEGKHHLKQVKILLRV